MTFNQVSVKTNTTRYLATGIQIETNTRYLTTGIQIEINTRYLTTGIQIETTPGISQQEYK